MADHADAEVCNEDNSSGASGSGMGSGDHLPPENRNCYKMNHKKRGTAVIINNKNFKKKGLTTRTGSDKDCQKMCSLFEMLGFKIILAHDLPKNNMEKLLVSEDKLVEYESEFRPGRSVQDPWQIMAKEDHSNRDCFACVILSHGDEGYICGTDGQIKIEKLVAPFKGDRCASLVGKPKLFFFQGCRGTSVDSGAEEAHDGGGSGDGRIPIEADFFMAYSVTAGKVSFRSCDRGSCFIQAIGEIFPRHCRDMDLLKMMTRVNRKVAYDFTSQTTNPAYDKKKQMPCFVSMLRKDVYFRIQN